MLVPSIDLSEGKAVQLEQGRRKVLERDDVFDLLDDFSLYGEVALIDLDAAFGRGSNRGLIEKLLALHPCRIGGGIRTLEEARFYLKAGATKVIVGTAADQDWITALPREQVIIAVDSRGDELLTEAWQKGTGVRTLDVLDRLGERCSEFLYTQTETEGMLKGLDRVQIDRILEASRVPVTVAGGISSLDDIRYLTKRNAHAQIGMAIYTGRLKLQECLAAQVDFGKSPLIPTIVQDFLSKDVLMLAYSTRESLAEAIRLRRGTYHSRSRSRIWRKGDTSGNLQRLIRIDVDCDGDTLLFSVEQMGDACHLDRWSCFAGTSWTFGLRDLDRILAERQTASATDSYTARLFADPKLQVDKLREETEELISATGRIETRWEAADLIYFTLVNARAKGVGLKEIRAELRSRHGNDTGG